MLRNLQPDAILLDLMMPKMDGFEFLDELNARGEWTDVPIVVITARELTEADRDRLDGRIEQIIQKTERDELLRQLRSALAEYVERRRGERTAVA